MHNYTVTTTITRKEPSITRNCRMSKFSLSLPVTCVALIHSLALSHCHDLRGLQLEAHFERIDHELTDMRFQRIDACGMTSYSDQVATVSGIACADECARQSHSGRCVAYDWDAGSGMCRTQDYLNVTAASGAGSVSVDSAKLCLEDGHCAAGAAAGEVCVRQACGGGQLGVCVSCEMLCHMNQ
jgi:hypothetical protein